MLSKNVAFTLLLLAGSACGQSVEETLSTESTGDGEKGLAARLGFSEFPKSDGLGHTSFYTGPQVLEEVNATGDFIPRSSVTYSMIRVPDSVVDSVTKPLDSRTLSLCETGSDVTLFHNVLGDNYKADPPDSVNCTPWVTTYDGRMTIEYYSGQEGVYGYAQIGRLENGNLFASARMIGRMPSTCEGDESIGTAGMHLGVLGPPVPPDDEVVQSCVAPE
jgi:hypothetical protein